MTKVEMLPLMPMRMLTLVRTTYAVLGILNKKEAGYMSGVIDQLGEKGKQRFLLEQQTGSAPLSDTVRYSGSMQYAAVLCSILQYLTRRAAAAGRGSADLWMIRRLFVGSR